MDINIKDEQLSDDEIFFGKLTLKELKKHILWDKPQQPWSVSAANSPTNVIDPNTSLKIIQTQSQPNLISDRRVYSSSEPNSPCKIEYELGDNDSFIKMENMVENICLSRSNIENTELNNTLEVIEYILNNPPTDQGNNKFGKQIPKKPDIKNEICKSPEKLAQKAESNEVLLYEQKTPKNVVNINKEEETWVTPLKYPNSYTTPRITQSKPVFKTPSQLLSGKKPSATPLKKTTSKTNAYHHISSPVASYIRNCPIVPLVKDVHPKKPLPGTSSIPKLVKNVLPTKSNDKENVLLPSVAYKSAKKTKVIDIPDAHKLPQCQWAKKIFSSLPKPMVIKHTHREMNSAKKIFTNHQEDSFANLSYQQADVSVCTQKSAFKPNNNV